MVSDGVINEGRISNNHINRKMLKFVNMYIQNVKNVGKKTETATHFMCQKKNQKNKNHKWTEEGKGRTAEVHRTT